MSGSRSGSIDEAPNPVDIGSVVDVDTRVPVGAIGETMIVQWHVASMDGPARTLTG